MARKRKTDHVVMRNGQPFCMHCGRSYQMNLPAPIRVVTGMINGFIAEHKDCKKTWEEPTIDTNGKSERECATFWLANGERGVSSETMFSTLYGTHLLPPERFSHPLDPDDFRRCHLLLETVPHWRERLSDLKALGDPWPALVDNWDKLTEMLEENMHERKDNGMYTFMKELGC